MTTQETNSKITKFISLPRKTKKTKGSDLEAKGQVSGYCELIVGIDKKCQSHYHLFGIAELTFFQ